MDAFCIFTTALFRPSIEASHMPKARKVSSPSWKTLRCLWCASRWTFTQNTQTSPAFTLACGVQTCLPAVAPYPPCQQQQEEDPVFRASHWFFYRTCIRRPFKCASMGQEPRLSLGCMDMWWCSWRSFGDNGWAAKAVPGINGHVILLLRMAIWTCWIGPEPKDCPCNVWIIHMFNRNPLLYVLKKRKRIASTHPH